MILGGCSAPTKQAHEVSPSGFLGDYSQLKPGKGPQALLVYVDPNAKIGQYDKILLDDLTVVPEVEKEFLAEGSTKELDYLKYYFRSTMQSNLKQLYKFTPTAGKDVMRIRVALTEAKSSKGRGGEATVEFEAVDSVTGKRLAASVDKRVGSQFAGLDKWRATRAAFDHWAGRLAVRLREIRSSK